MIILDTNVLSALMHVNPPLSVVTWLNRQPRMSIWTTSITIFEIQFGLSILAAGKRRSTLQQDFEDALAEIGRRVISFDDIAASKAADLMASRRRKGRTVELRDTMIAGIALEHNATLATRNISHFGDLSVPVIDPWSA